MTSYLNFDSNSDSDSFELIVAVAAGADNHCGCSLMKMNELGKYFEIRSCRHQE